MAIVRQGKFDGSIQRHFPLTYDPSLPSKMDSITNPSNYIANMHVIE